MVSILTNAEMLALHKSGMFASIDILEGNINKAWRRWALRNHPDKGGDSNSFAYINNIVSKLKENRNIYMFATFVRTQEWAKYYKPPSPPKKPSPPTAHDADMDDLEAQFRRSRLFKEAYKKFMNEINDAPLHPRPKQENDDKQKQYTNVKTGRLVTKGSSTYKKYIRNGWTVDEKEMVMKPPS